MPAPKEILEFVEKFKENEEEYIANSYKEARLRADFIDPFFKILGWDMYNNERRGEIYREVVYEDTVEIGGKPKAPDYSFRVGNTRKFFVETKQPATNLQASRLSAFQLRRYAWSANLPLSILTNFRQFAVYDGRIEPKESDEPYVARIIYLTLDEYDSNWEQIANVFSREAAYSGAYDDYVWTLKEQRGSLKVNTAFLKEIESWRSMLASNIAARNHLSTRELNEAVQLTIDRIIFLRICEDRGIERYGRLQGLLQSKGVYGQLCKLFHLADQRYNSGLFHFEEDKERSSTVDNWTLTLSIDDHILIRIITHLYYPNSPYEFSVMSADILGQVYEQFLGKVIEQNAKGEAEVKDKPEVKKAGGVFYTPVYPVDFIVKQVIGIICKDKTPEQVEKLRLIDPACGSGSFLISAYQHLLDWYLEWYLKKGKRRHAKKIYEAKGGVWHLTATEKKHILLSNIYGVDIDSQAVEVTKLSLLLKVLEDESSQSISDNLRLFHERALPDLANNIKCGNSLIEPNFFDLQGSRLDKEERIQINAFDWKAEFPSVMGTGGFDAVIGNPPWGADFTDQELEYLRNNHRRVIDRMIDSYIYFIDKATQIANPDAPIGFIIPSTILNQVDARAIRDVLITRGISALVSLGQNIFGTKVLNTSTILISARQNVDETFILDNLSNLPLKDRRTALNKVAPTAKQKWQELVRHDPHFTFFVDKISGSVLLDRLRSEHLLLSQVIQGTIQRGVSPDVVTAHVVSSSEVEKEALEIDLLRRSVSGNQIKRYRHWLSDQLIIYTTRLTEIDKYPNVAAHLEKFRHLNTCKEVDQDKHPWWSLHRPRNPQIFASPKLIGLTTSKTIELIYDEKDSIYVTDAMYVFSLLPGYSPWATMAILQSKAFLFFYRVANQGESRVIPQVKASKLQTLPYPTSTLAHPAIGKLDQYCHEMIELYNDFSTTKVAQDKIIAQRQIDAMDQRIDKLVYELYGLTGDEIQLIESSF